MTDTRYSTEITGARWKDWNSGHRPGDEYPSRIGSRPRIYPRLEPVIHGAAMGSKALSVNDARAFEKDGFVVLRDLFDADRVDLWREEMFTLLRDPSIGARPEAIEEPGGGAVRSIFRIHELSKVFSDLARDPLLLDIARTILDDDVYIHQSRLNYKPGFLGREFYWHSDFETWHVEDGMPRMRAVSISIALSENNEFNGPVMLIPGSHRTYVACVGETPEDHYKRSLRKQEYGVPDEDSLCRLMDEGGIVAPKGPPGTTMVFDCNTMHGSNGNITPFPRSNAFFVYNACSNRLVDPFGGRPPRPSFIANRDCPPLSPAR